MMIRFLCLFLVCFPIYATDVISVKKNHNDRREYQGLVLSNGLKVLLISDSSLEKNAAAIDVQVGSFAEPDNRLGLAHLLEHMLDLGTEKYPEPDSFTNFVTKHGGHYNAYTENENTRYSVSIDTNYFDQALDHFSQFFINPLFSEDLIERELNAIESEYRLNIKDDEYRVAAVMAYTSNPKHPFHRFNIGSLQTLGDYKGQVSIRETLVDFYKNYYSPDKMTLVIAGPQKINQLQIFATKHFDNIPKRDAKSFETSELALDKEFAQDLSVKSISEQHELKLLFRMKSLKGLSSKSLDFIMYLLNRTDSGSLRNYLWNNTWITDYIVSYEEVTSAQDVLEIKYKLTSSGQNNIEQITSATLQYIRFLSEQAIEPNTFNDFKKANIRNDNFKAGQSEITLIQNYVKKLHYFPIDEVVLADCFTEDTSLNIEEAKNLVSELNPNNMRRIYINKNVSSKTVEPWYKVSYSVAAYNSAQNTIWSQPIKYTFSKPLPNDLLPENLSINPVSGNILIPGMVLQSQQLQLFHKQDNRFKEPKVSIKLLLRSSNSDNSVENVLKLNFTSRAIMEQLVQYKSIFELAGIKCHISPNPQGLVIDLEMFSDKIKEILSIIAEKIVNVSLEEWRFEVYKQDIKSELSNERFQPLFVQAMNNLFTLINNPSYSVNKKLERIDQLNVGDIKSYWKDLLSNAKIVGLISGNINDVQAISSAKFFSSKINSTPSQNVNYAAMPKLVEYQANDRYGFEFSSEHHDHAIASYFQIADLGKLSIVKMMLMNLMLSAPLYDQLRIHEQLGYVVFAHPYNIKERPGVIFVIESPAANPVMLNSKLNDFFKLYHNKIDEMTNANFEQYKSSLMANLLVKPKSIAEDAKYNWSKILDGTNDFNFNKELAAKLANIKIQDMRNFFKNSLLTTQKSANVIVYTKINQKNIAEDYIPINEK